MYLDTSFLQPFLPFIEAQNAGGRVWLIGGQVYRRLVEQRYHVPCASLHDIDLLYERRKAWEDLVVPEGWSLIKTGVGGARFQRGDKQLDAAGLEEVVNPWESASLRGKTTQERIASFLRRTPLTIQSCIMDLETGMVSGDIGLQALHTRTVAIYNAQECQQRCARHNESSEEYCARTARSLGFSVGSPGLLEKIVL